MTSACAVEGKVLRREGEGEGGADIERYLRKGRELGAEVERKRKDKLGGLTRAHSSIKLKRRTAHNN